jgi:hypothetical protein
MDLPRALIVCLLIAATVSLGMPAEPQQEQPQEEPEPVSYEFFSGTVAEIQQSRLTVVRTVPGKPPEKHTFILKPDTRVEGKLRTRSRVTVGYISTEEGDIALRVVVRQNLPRR